jgi:hypothetical protein
MSLRREIFATDASAVLARHRVLLTKSWHRRAGEFATPVAVLGLALFSI